MAKYSSANEMKEVVAYQIDNYRVDFLLKKVGGKPLVVELDGHDFHETDEKQRRYEKTRDRYLVSNGYQVIHYTGKEVTDDPFKPAIECLSLTLNLPADHFQYGF